MTAQDKSDRELLLETHTKVAVMAEVVERVEDKITEQNGRLGALEKWRNIVIGAVGAMIVVMPFLIYELRQAIAEILAGGATP